MKTKDQIKDANRTSFNDRSGVHEIDIDKAMDEYAEEFAKACIRYHWPTENGRASIDKLIASFKESLKTSPSAPEKPTG